MSLVSYRTNIPTRYSCIVNITDIPPGRGELTGACLEGCACRGGSRGRCQEGCAAGVGCVTIVSIVID